MKKSFKETKIGAFLSSKAPKVLQALGDVLPDKGTLGIVKNIIAGDNKIKAVDKEQAMKLIEQDIAEMKEVSSRWRSDMKSDSWLSKNTRPLALIFLTASAVLMMSVDSFHLQFNVDEEWISLLKTLLVTVYVAYFGSRGNITAVSAGGAVTGFTFIAKGDAKVGETIILSPATSGGDGFQVIISADSLSNLTADSRGAMIYNNNDIAQDISIITEAGTAVTFENVPKATYVGNTHPILAIELTGGAGILAVY